MAIVNYRIEKDKLGFDRVDFTRDAARFAEQLAFLAELGRTPITGEVDTAEIRQAVGRYFTFPTGQTIPLWDAVNALRNAQ